MTPSVLAVVVNHDGGAWVEAAAESLLAQDYPALEVVVVDNASSDGSAGRLEARFGSALRLVRMGVNPGFGAANNRAIGESRSRHVVLLNSDAVAEPGFVAALVDAAESGERCGMVAAKLLEIERPEVIDNVGHLLYPDGLNRGRGRGEPDRGQYDADRRALFPSGAAALYRRDMLDEIGGFDESFFLYGEDADLGLRGRLRGWECALAPCARARHHYSRGTGAYSTLKAFYVERNRILVLAKLFPPVLLACSPAFTAWRLAHHAISAGSGRGSAGRLARDRSGFHLVATLVRAWRGALPLLPPALRQRRRLRRSRRLSDAGFLALLREFRLSAAEAAFKD